MAGGVNKAFIIGRLGRDPQGSQTSSGRQLAALSVATSEKWKDKTGQEQTHTEWHRVVVWGRQAELCMEHLRKGSQVFVEGRIQSRKYTDQDGAERRVNEIIATTVQFLGSRSDTSASPVARQDDALGWDAQGDDTPF